jgi:hypothetical protein
VLVDVVVDVGVERAGTRVADDFGDPAPHAAVTATRSAIARHRAAPLSLQ